MNESFTELDELSQKEYNEFIEVYARQSLVDSNLTREVVIGSILNPRRCRFCGKSEPEVKFRNKAHLFPQAIGNRYLLTNFECDNCNHLFGTYEDSFAKFLSLQRTTAFVKNRNKKKNKTARHIEQTNQFEIVGTEKGIMLGFSESTNESAVRLDVEKKELEISATLPPYTPLFVYKALVKIAVSLVPETEVPNVGGAIKFLMDSEFDSRMRGFDFCRVYVTSVPSELRYQRPVAITYFKEDEAKDLTIPYRTLVLFFSNNIYQIFLPFIPEDELMMTTGGNFKLFPALVGKGWREQYGNPSSQCFDMSSNEINSTEKVKLKVGFGKVGFRRGTSGPFYFKGKEID